MSIKLDRSYTSLLALAFLALACGDDSRPRAEPEAIDLPALQQDLALRSELYPEDIGLIDRDPAYAWIERIQLTRSLRKLSLTIQHSPIIAVLDSGVDPSAPALSGRLYDTSTLRSACGQGGFGCDTSSYQYPDAQLGKPLALPLGTKEPGEGCDNLPFAARARCFHGTHVAGIIAGFEKDSGVFGVCPSCRIIPIKITREDGSITDDAIYAALAYVAELKNQGVPIRIVNASFGKLQGSARVNQALSQLTQTFPDLLLVAAAGNENTALASYPASHPQVISVANVRSSDLVKDRSSNFGTTIDIAAPVGPCDSFDEGYGIISSIPGRFPQSVCLNGTSMAAPMVAGVAGNYLAQHPEWTGKYLKEKLLQAADAEALYTANPSYARETAQGLALRYLGRGLLKASLDDDQTKISPKQTKEKRINPGCGSLGGEALSPSAKSQSSSFWFLFIVLFLPSIRLALQHAKGFAKAKPGSTSIAPLS